MAVKEPEKRRHHPLLKHIGVYLLRGITLLIAVSIIAFALVEASPIDPVQKYVDAIPGVTDAQRQAIAEHWGLDEPPVERYLNWAGSLLQGDLGTSLIYRRPVADIIGEKFIASLALMLAAWGFSSVLGFGLGVLMGVHKGRPLDRILKRLSLILSAIPTYWIGIVLIMVFSVWLDWFPLGMAVPAGVKAADVTLADRLHHLILPALTLGLLSFASIALHTREKMIDVLASDYVLFAKARGESPWGIVRLHGLRNVALPAITMVFASFSELFGGSVLAETVFSYPGLGSAASEAALASDVPLLLGITLFSAVFVFTGNLIANIIYGILDPRIREG